MPAYNGVSDAWQAAITPAEDETWYVKSGTLLITREANPTSLDGLPIRQGFAHRVKAGQAIRFRASSPVFVENTSFVREAIG